MASAGQKNKVSGDSEVNRTALGNQRVKRLMLSLVDKLKNSFWKAGEPLPSENTLAKEYGVSRSAVHQVLNQIEAEHLVYQVRGVGTFAGSPGIASVGKKTFLFLSDDRSTTNHLVRLGFEERIAQSGASSIAIPYSKVLDFFEKGHLSGITGVFDEVFHPDDEHASRLRAFFSKKHRVNVWRSGFSSSKLDADYVFFDDVDGGRQATVHLLEHGHVHIAFMGLHVEGRNDSEYLWSMERCKGWSDALTANGVQPAPASVILPSRDLRADRRHVDIGYDLGEKILTASPAFSGLVCANDKLACGVIRRLSDSGCPHECWPVIVGFDDSELSASMGLSSLHLSWKELGATGAELLLDRASGKLQGPYVKLLVKMKLIKRLTTTGVSYDTVKHMMEGIPA